MNVLCILGLHDFSKDCGKCRRCGQQRFNTHQWEVESLPSDSPSRHQCTKCRKLCSVMDVWPTCQCPNCRTFRSHDVRTLVSIVTSKNGRYYSKSRHSGIYEFTADYNEVPLALAVLTERLKNDVHRLDDNDLAEVASIPNITIHVQGPCDAPCEPKNVDSSAVIQMARQEMAKRH